LQRERLADAEVVVLGERLPDDRVVGAQRGEGRVRALSPVETEALATFRSTPLTSTVDLPTLARSERTPETVVPSFATAASTVFGNVDQPLADWTTYSADTCFGTAFLSEPTRP